MSFQHLTRPIVQRQHGTSAKIIIIIEQNKYFEKNAKILFHKACERQNNSEKRQKHSLKVKKIPNY